ncbi:hypothetical protein GQ44DRAFT_627722 [Phaeosphaeriaceae sp. PMI808]|nr:hypothetical protein GQ44DRAFT_627722 [Phaeosphaeriaceae sp. PMI808]
MVSHCRHQGASHASFQETTKYYIPPFKFALHTLVCVLHPTMSHETVYYSHPRTYGKGSRNCIVNGEKKKSGLIRKYGLNMGR